MPPLTADNVVGINTPYLFFTIIFIHQKFLNRKVLGSREVFVF